MFKTLRDKVPKDKDLPARAFTIQWRDEFRTGAIYDRLPHEFHQQKPDNRDEYIPLAERSPSVRYGLPTIIVNDTTSLLFSEGHFPAIETKSEDADTIMQSLVKETRLREIMLDAAVRGSVGSIAIWFRVLKGRVFYKVMQTQFLTPEWDPEEPDVLKIVTEKYKVRGEALVERGYGIDKKDLKRDFWFCRVWDATAETWMQPWPVKSTREERAAQLYPEPMVPDPIRTVKHDLGFVPIEWIKNLPGGDDIDGACTFEPALPNSIEIDYQLSQGGRGLKYSSDPTMHIKEPAYQELSGGQPIIKSADNAIVTSDKGEVKLLEISGSASAAVIGYVEQLRQISLELCGGNRTSPDRIAAAQSGKAMELMNQGLIWLADKLRTSYGEVGLLNLLRMVVKANATKPLKIGGKAVAAGTLSAIADTLSLKWPDWYHATAADDQASATALVTYVEGGIISPETAVKQIQHRFDIEDPAKELAAIKQHRDEQAKAQADLQRALKPPVQPVRSAA